MRALAAKLYGLETPLHRQAAAFSLAVGLLILLLPLGRLQKGWPPDTPKLYIPILLSVLFVAASVGLFRRRDWGRVLLSTAMHGLAGSLAIVCAVMATRSDLEPGHMIVSFGILLTPAGMAALLITLVHSQRFRAEVLSTGVKRQGPARGFLKLYDMHWPSSAVFAAFSGALSLSFGLVLLGDWLADVSIPEICEWLLMTFAVAFLLSSLALAWRRDLGRLLLSLALHGLMALLVVLWVALAVKATRDSACLPELSGTLLSCVAMAIMLIRALHSREFRQALGPPRPFVLKARALIVALIGVSLTLGVMYLCRLSLLVWALQYPALRDWAKAELIDVGPDAVPAISRVLRESGHQSASRAAMAALAEISQSSRDHVPALLEALTHTDPSIRASAAHALGEIGPRSRAAVTALIGALKDEETNVRCQAELALALIDPGAGAAVPALIEALRDKDKHVRWVAGKALARIGPGAKAAVPALIEALKDEGENVRWMAGYALEEMGSDARAAVPALIEALKDEDEGVRAEAAEALAEIDPNVRVAVPVLLKMLEDELRHRRSRAAAALGKIGPDVEAAVSAFIDASKDKRTHVWGNYALFKIASRPDTIPALIEAMGDENGDVREEAADALGRIGPDARAAVPALTKALSDEHEGVRYYAALALAAIGPDAGAAVPALIRALRDEKDFVRWKAARALGRIGPDAEAAIPAVIEMLDAGDGPDRWVAAEALAEIGPDAEAAVPALTKALEDDDEDVRGATAKALGAIGPDAKAAVPALTEALKDEDERVRKEAAEALKKIRGEEEE